MKANLINAVNDIVGCINARTSDLTDSETDMVFLYLAELLACTARASINEKIEEVNK